MAERKMAPLRGAEPRVTELNLSGGNAAGAREGGENTRCAVMHIWAGLRVAKPAVGMRDMRGMHVEGNCVTKSMARRNGAAGCRVEFAQKAGGMARKVAWMVRD
jgi:hypothetical protein